MASIILVLFRFSSNLHQHTSTPSERNEIIYQMVVSTFFRKFSLQSLE